MSDLILTVTAVVTFLSSPIGTGPSTSIEAQVVAPDPQILLARTAEQPRIRDPWYALALCESRGPDGQPRWDANTGNGFLGGLQFVLSTWLWMRGDEYAPYPHLATPQEQIAVAERLVAVERSQGRGGFNPWPACADRLGLPR